MSVRLELSNFDRRGAFNNRERAHLRVSADMWHVHEGSCAVAAAGAPVTGWTYRA